MDVLKELPEDLQNELREHMASSSKSNEQKPATAFDKLMHTHSLSSSSPSKSRRGRKPGSSRKTIKVQPVSNTHFNIELDHVDDEAIATCLETSSHKRIENEPKSSKTEKIKERIEWSFEKSTS